MTPLTRDDLMQLTKSDLVYEVMRLTKLTEQLKQQIEADETERPRGHNE